MGINRLFPTFVLWFYIIFCSFRQPKVASQKYKGKAPIPFRICLI